MTAASMSSTGATDSDSTTASGGESSTTAGVGCGACDQPNQTCIDDVCVDLCQGMEPDFCGPEKVCDIISGECKDPDAACTVAGESQVCGEMSCGPGTICDGEGECLAIAPCAGVACTEDGDCWGEGCSCSRDKECDDASEELLNGPFSDMIAGLDFADDCTAWMVTLRGGTDYLRRLRPDGELTEWPGVSNLDMGEVKVLRRLTIPQLTALPDDLAGEIVTPPLPAEAYGEVALSYICCAMCGCAQDPPQGVARLDEENMDEPLALVVTATTTQGTGPFMNKLFDAGPQGLTWSEGRVFYVGNTTANGEFNAANLEKGTQELVNTFDERVTAAAPISPVHLLVALEGGGLLRFNVNTKDTQLVLDVDAGITSLSHDKFTGLVYAGLSTLEVVEIDPFTGDFSTFATMPGKGRVAVSPSGRLWFMPVKYIQPGTLSAWDLPSEI
ncbi:MAG TPA: hypothetical protein ENK31_02355 [Nannocystis exedens]|nr:hypothetical protein [Nannocystis exedens]